MNHLEAPQGVPEPDWAVMTGGRSGFMLYDIDRIEVAAEGGEAEIREEAAKIVFSHPKLREVRQGVWSVQGGPDRSVQIFVDPDGPMGEAEPEPVASVLYRHPDRFLKAGGAFHGSQELFDLFYQPSGRPWHDRKRYDAAAILMPFWPRAAHHDPLGYTVYRLLKSAYAFTTPPWYPGIKLTNW